MHVGLLRFDGSSLQYEVTTRTRGPTPECNGTSWGLATLHPRSSRG